MFDHLVSETLFFQLAALTFLSAVAGIVALRLRQPLILAFIFVGMVTGPDALAIIRPEQLAPLETLSEMGIAILLFMVGLKLDIAQIRTLGVSVASAGIAQVFLTTLAGGMLGYLLGYEWHESLFIGFMLSFSSTIIVVKLLSDQRRLDSLYGRISLGVLIVQDIIVIMATVAFGALGSAGQGADIWGLALKFLAVVCVTALIIRFCSCKMSALVSSSAELMIVFSMGFAGVAAGLCDAIGLSRELGGLLAGIALANTSLNHILSSRLTALRDFLLLFFFLLLGMHLHLESLRAQAGVLAALAVFVLLAKPAIVYGIMRVMRYRPRTGFMTGLSLGQVSEFSLILAVMMSSSGQIDKSVPNIVTGLALLTTGFSTAMIYYGSYFSDIWEKLSGEKEGVFQKQGRMSSRLDERGDAYHPEVILIGLGRYGSALAQALKMAGVKILGVDFDPEAIRKAEKIEVQTLYGDASDPEFISQLPFLGVKTIIFCFHHTATGPLLTDLRRTLAGHLRSSGYQGHIATTSHHDQSDADLAQHGIDIVLRPFEDAACSAAERVLSSIR